MSAEQKYIHYKIFFKNTDYVFDQTVVLTDQYYEHAAPEGEPPQWCDLEYKRCPNCTLDPIWHKRCPLAVRLIPYVNLPSIKSYDEVTAVVEMDHKTTSTETSAQEALSSLMGVIMASSGCPHTRFFKPMAWHHHPFATPEETLYLACTTYLSSYVFSNKDHSCEVSFDDLKEIYNNIHQVNVHIAQRIHNHSATDSALNAIVLLDMITKDLPLAVDEGLTELTQIFKSHVNLFQGRGD